MPSDITALRFLIDAVLRTNDARCMDVAEDRDALAAAIVEVLVEYLGEPKKGPTK